jgi:FkbM family methyltransferase
MHTLFSKLHKSIIDLINTIKYITYHPLNRQSQFKAILGFLKWQIGSRLTPGQVVYNWINNSRMIVQPGETGFTLNIYCGLHEFSDMAFVLHTLTKDDLFVDIGANVGAYTVLACAVKGARGFSIEPVPSTYNKLMDNIRLNDLSNRVSVLNMGIADREGNLAFTSNQNCTNHVVAEDESVSDIINVKVLPLDIVLENESPSVLKIDVEGFETSVLNGADKTLKNKSLHSVIMELDGHGARYGFSDDTLIETMASYGFMIYSYDPFMRVLTKQSRQKTQSGNTLFIRDISIVKDKITSAPPIKIRTAII